MSPVRRARAPRTALYRIGRRPDPLAWPPWDYVGSGRFDDPAGEFRVLYTTAQRRTAFLESLARFRLSLDVLAALQAVQNTTELLPRPQVPVDWYHARALGQVRLGPRQRWVDLRSFETREALRRELSQALIALGLEDLDLSGVVGPKRQLTQAIARWAYDHGYASLVYSSRFDAALTCWAIFEGATFEPILPDDPDLVATAKLFELNFIRSRGEWPSRLMGGIRHGRIRYTGRRKAVISLLLRLAAPDHPALRSSREFHTILGTTARSLKRPSRPSAAAYMPPTPAAITTS